MQILYLSKNGNIQKITADMHALEQFEKRYSIVEEEEEYLLNKKNKNIIFLKYFLDSKNPNKNILTNIEKKDLKNKFKKKKRLSFKFSNNNKFEFLIMDDKIKTFILRGEYRNLNREGAA